MKYNTIFENKKWLVIEHLDYEAAKEMAEGSKWCTAHREHYFRLYFKKGHVFYCHNKKDPNIKYGLSIHNKLEDGYNNSYELVDKSCYRHYPIILKGETLPFPVEKIDLPLYILKKLFKYHKTNLKTKDYGKESKR